MPTQVIGHEGGNEVVAVVVTLLATEGERDSRVRTCTFQQFRAKLFPQKRIGIADIDQKIGKSGAVPSDLRERNRTGQQAPASSSAANTDDYGITDEYRIS